ncbi:hypothetical protein A2V49_02845 [candidate division WWE3 bacterium RBG_19FT_COMBO_34_6]|uniref:Uncharacterized protein n=1 Tax=candidate division WWE3 bacterium RBG_19FT_COMBO_34_6 TaxID=1802612 RepID=A0A1F4UN90_UNCKA|nr:MAG: hypothetical protein A2V49_02845 [candidate division WWE3 bacterium RBG_19FT_COMBO_34_6]
MNKKLLIVPLLVTVISLSGYFIPKTYADEGEGFFPSFLQKLIEKFNLNKDVVQNFWGNYRDERQQEIRQTRRQQIIERLTELIRLKKLNETQKNELLTIMEKHQDAMDDLREKTFEERQKIQEEHREELEAWAKNNNLDLDDLNIGFFSRKGRGMGPGMGVGYDGRGMMGRYINN